MQSCNPNCLKRHKVVFDVLCLSSPKHRHIQNVCNIADYQCPGKEPKAVSHLTSIATPPAYYALYSGKNFDSPSNVGSLFLRASTSSSYFSWSKTCLPIEN